MRRNGPRTSGRLRRAARTVTPAGAATLAYGMAVGALAVTGAAAAPGGCGAAPPPLAGAGRTSPPASAWTGSWGTAMASAGPARKSGVTGRQTLRMVVHSSIGGTTSRVHLVNTFSRWPVVIGHVTIAARGRGPAAAATPVTLTFRGRRQTTIPAGRAVYSDPASFPVADEETLLVSVYLPDAVASAPYHDHAMTTSYTSAPGDTADRAAEAGGARFTRAFPHWAYLGGLDVTAAGSGGTVVALGDSQTDGGHTTPDTDRRWVDDYGRALQSRRPAMGVLNEGISGNRLLTDRSRAKAALGASALHRFGRDVLSQPNVRSVILYEGVNDLAIDGTTARSVEQGIQRLAVRARAAGLRLTVATVPPFGGYLSSTAARERARQCVNGYIRTTSDIDGYVDFDRATRDPLAPSRLRAGYFTAGDDRLHLNDAGNRALAKALQDAPPPPRARRTAGVLPSRPAGLVQTY